MGASVFPHIEQALVTVRRRPAALAVPILTMAIGIGGRTAIFSALWALGEDRQHKRIPF